MIKNKRVFAMNSKADVIVFKPAGKASPDL
jgi:hypothetical protein